MNVANKSLLKRIGALTLPGVLIVVALALVVISLVVEERGVGPDLMAGKNWVLLIASVFGVYAIVSGLGRAGLRSAPARTAVSLAVFVLLFYVSLQELQNRKYYLLNMSASTVQMLLLAVLVAPMMARVLKVGIPDLVPGEVLTRV